jgi:hypothetical protein
VAAEGAGGGALAIATGAGAAGAGATGAGGGGALDAVDEFNVGTGGRPSGCGAADALAGGGGGWVARAVSPSGFAGVAGTGMAVEGAASPKVGGLGGGTKFPAGCGGAIAVAVAVGGTKGARVTGEAGAAASGVGARPAGGGANVWTPRGARSCGVSAAGWLISSSTDQSTSTLGRGWRNCCWAATGRTLPDKTTATKAAPTINFAFMIRPTLRRSGGREQPPYARLALHILWKTRRPLRGAAISPRARKVWRFRPQYCRSQAHRRRHRCRRQIRLLP